MANSTDGHEEREQQLDALIAEYYRAEAAGQAPDHNEFIAQHPEFAKELTDFFEDVLMLHRQDRPDPQDSALEPPLTPNTSRQKNSPAASVVRYFGEYEILEELGAGGMGVVYKAQQTKLKRIVALKMIRAGALANSQDVQRFETEAKAAAQLSHPGIVSVHEVGIHNGQHFYTMDYVEGGSLSRLHRDEPVASKRAAKLVRRLAESMHYAHQQGIVHRDLKPANILLTAKGAPRITDFGLAKRIRTDDESHPPTLTETGAILGTAGYMSPEQAAGKSRLVGPSSDVYSLGAVLYALLTSRAPFVGETPTHTILQVLQKEPISPRKISPTVPRDLETICLKCLEKEPHKRYGTAQLLADDLRLFLDGKPVKARPVSSIERGWRWCRRNSVLTALLGVILLVVLCSPIVGWNQVITMVNGVQEARGAALPKMISDLQKYPSFLVTPILNSRFEKEPEAHRKLNLAFALVAFGTVKTDYLVSQVEAIGEDNTSNLYDALAADRETSLTALGSESVTSTIEKKWRRKFQLAILALFLGNPDLAADMCQVNDRPDPVQRTVFIDELPRWDGDMAELSPLLKSTADLGLRSAVMLGIGSISDGRLSVDEKRSWQSLAMDWYASQSDRVTHSAAGWLLRQWHVPLPEIPISTGQQPTNDWYLNSQGQTFLLMTAGSFHQLAESNVALQDWDVVIAEPFWLSDREVSVGQFQRFMDDSDYSPADKPADWEGADEQFSPAPDHPVQQVSWYDAVSYCNWLSMKDQLSPAYERSGLKEKIHNKEYDVWRLMEGSCGYRLPSSVEWEYACRAGTTTNWASGDDEALLWGYAQYRATKTQRCGVKLQNAWGLWDMHGNVYEWCDDRYLNTQSSCAIRGGSYFKILAADQLSSDHATVPRSFRNPSAGFRVARTSRRGSLTAATLTEGQAKAEIVQLVPERSSLIASLESIPWIASGRAITSVQHSFDSSLALLGGYDRFAGLFDRKAKKEGQVFRGHEHTVWSVALSPDGQTAVTGSEDKTLGLWDVATGQELDRFTADGIFSCVRYSADGKSVLATNWDTKVRIWKLSEGKLGDLIEFTYPTSPLDIAMMPDQKQFVIGTASGHILLCDAETGVVQKKFDGHSGWVHNVVVLDSGKRILSASYDSTLRLWDVDSAKTDRVYLGHQGVVNEVRVLPDGKRFLSCGADRTVRLWDVESRKELARGIGSGELRGLSIAPDGKSCVTAGLDGSLWEWELPETSEASADSTDRNIPQMLTSDAFQADFIEKHKLLLRPMHLFLEVDPATNLPFYAIDWGPADGQDFIVHHGMSDLTLEQNEAQAVLQGYKRAEVKTVTIDGVNHHIGLWKK